MAEPDLTRVLAGDAPSVVVFAVLIYHLVRAGGAHVARLLEQIQEVLAVLRRIRDILEEHEKRK